MGKNRRRNRRRRHRNKNKSAAMKFTEYTSRITVETSLADEVKREQQQKYQKLVQELETDILCRTIFVTNVKDLRQESNLLALKQFMEQNYGLVERCERASFASTITISKRRRRRSHNSYPPGRIRFVSRQHAERVFGGVPLAEVLATQQQGTGIQCPAVLSVRGKPIWVRPARRNQVQDLVSDQLKGDSVQLNNITKFSLGHWFPNEYDAYHELIIRDDDEGTTANNLEGIMKDELFVEEESSQKGVFSMNIDLKKRCVEIQADFGTVSDDESGGVGTVSDDESGGVADLINKIHWAMFDRREEAPKPKEAPSETLSGKQVLSFRFKELRSHMEICMEQNAVVFALKWPPKLYRTSQLLFSELISKGNDRIRTTRFGSIKGFDRALGIKVTLDKTSMQTLLHHSAYSKLSSFGVLPKESQSSHHSSRIRIINIERSKDALDRALHQDLHRLARCNPEIGLILRAFVDNGRCSWYHLQTDKVDSLTLPQLLLETKYRGERLEKIAIATLERMLSLDSPGCTKSPCKLFVELASDNLISAREDDQDEDNSTIIPEYCVRVPRLLLSPCQERVLEVGVEISNRVIRKFTSEYGFHPCSFLRVQVGDESEKQLFDWSEDVELRVRSTLQNGIAINGKMYKFLAYTSSQLKEFSLWMVSLDGSKIVTNIPQMRTLLGDFSKCATVSKWAARLGQCFSTTVEGNISNKRILSNPKVIPDILSFSGKEHSDGTGIVSRQLFNEMIKGLPFSPADPNDVSIVQVRFGGAKGTLSAWGDERLRQPEIRRHRCTRSNEIILRESQTKFDTDYSSVEICSVGTTIPYYLNRHVILLLKVHGITDSTFLDMLHSGLNALDAMLSDADEAARLLPCLSGADSSMVSALQSMLHSGLTPATEPFLFSALHAIRAHHLVTLRKKARVFVERGAVLMGGLDEKSVLKEGEVFVQVSKKVGNPAKVVHEVVSGPVMVTKHPALHPGDVRMLKAVEIPELSGHTNVILFSQKGHRPEADKMSGSDLDGDQFAVCWDPNLFLRGENQTPLDFDPPLSDAAGNAMPGTEEEQDPALVQHFVNHMKNDNLGRIATMWLDFAAKSGADCPQCIGLAKLHSIAVDFPKSGIPAVIPDDLVYKKPKPHWREVKGQASFHCESIIGKLYDQVVMRDKDKNFLHEHEALAGRKVDGRYGRVLSFFDDPRKAKIAMEKVCNRRIPLQLGIDGHPLKEYLVEEANETRQQYDDDLRRLINKYKVQSEGELFTGCIRKYHKQNKKKQFRIAEEVRRSVREIRNLYRYYFFDSVLRFADDPPNKQEIVQEEDEEDELLRYVEETVTCTDVETIRSMNDWEQNARCLAFALAGANYLSTYDARPDESSALFSFPWTVADVIHGGLLEASSRQCSDGINHYS